MTQIHIRNQQQEKREKQRKRCEILNQIIILSVRNSSSVKNEDKNNQGVENAGVAFVKGANNRNVFFEKNKQTVMYDEQVLTNKSKD